MLLYGLGLLESDADRAILADFYQRYEKKLYHVARHYLGSPAKAEDALHDAMVKMILHFDDLKRLRNSRKELGAWCVTITKNVCLSMLRKEKPLQELPEEWDPPAPDDVESTDAFHRLVTLIQSLPETYRTVLELRLISEWKSQDIAALLNISVGTVDVRISRERAMLARRLREEGYEIDGL